MITFARLWEQIEKEKGRSPLMDGEEDGPTMAVLKAGRDLHKEKQTPFWDEFISLCNNSEGLSNLLGISREKIQSWPSRIKNGLSKLESHTSESPYEKENKKIIPTGTSGAFTVNQDPNLGEMP